MSMTGRRPLLSSRLSSGSNQPKSHLMQRRGKESEERKGGGGGIREGKTEFAYLHIMREPARARATREGGERGASERASERGEGRGRLPAKGTNKGKGTMKCKQTKRTDGWGITNIHAND